MHPLPGAFQHPSGRGRRDRVVRVLGQWRSSMVLYDVELAVVDTPGTAQTEVMLSQASQLHTGQHLHTAFAVRLRNQLALALGLLIGVVRRAHHGAWRHVWSSVAFLGEPGERLRLRTKRCTGKWLRTVAGTGPGSDVDTVFPHALHDFDDSSSVSPSIAGRTDVRHHLLEFLQQGQRPLVVRTRARSSGQARASVCALAGVLAAVISACHVGHGSPAPGFRVSR